MTLNDIQNKYGLNIIGTTYLDSHTNQKIFTVNEDQSYSLHVTYSIDEWDEEPEKVLTTITKLDKTLFKYYQYEYKRLMPMDVMEEIDNKKIVLFIIIGNGNI